MPVFASIQLSESAPPFGLIIYIGKAVNRLFNATKFSDGLGQFCGPVIHPERPHDRRCLDDTQLERTGQPKHVVPVFLDQICIHAMPCHTIQAAIIGSRIDAPVAGTPNIGDSRTEPVAEQPEQTEDHIGVGSGVGHDLGRMQFRLLFQNHREQKQAVPYSAGDHNRIQTGELVRNQVVVSHAVFITKILGVRSGIESANGNNKADSVSRRHLAASPQLDNRDSVLCGDQTGVCLRQSFVADEVLIHPGKP